MYEKLPEGIRAFDDTQSIRNNIYNYSKDAIAARFPIEDDLYRIDIDNLDYEDEKEKSLDEQKKAILTYHNLGASLKGRLTLTDKRTNKVLDSREDVIARVPYYSPRGTIINNGSEYAIVNQSRLRPGVYTRRKASGETEAQFNVIPGSGKGFRMNMDPDTGTFRLNLAQSQAPAYPFLKAMGITDQEMVDTWGKELWEVNSKGRNTGALKRIYERFAGRLANLDAGDEEIGMWLRENLKNYKMDPRIVQSTLGLKDQEGIDNKVLLRATQRILNVGRGHEDPDDRDSPRYKMFLGPEDLYKERIERDVGQLGRNLLYKVRRSKNLKPFHRGLMTKYFDSLLQGSGLALPLEESNPSHYLEQMNRVTAMGEGGIRSSSAITDDARGIAGNQLGFLDPIAGPECHDDQTEVYTSTGWVPWPEVTEDTLFACSIDNRLEFHKAERLVAEDYQGDMYNIESGPTRFSVTPNHRMWCIPLGVEEPRYLSAEEVYGRSITCVNQDNFEEGAFTDHWRVFLLWNTWVRRYYDGKVYCATVPGGLLLTRRNNSVGVWSGNSEKIGIDARFTYGTYKGNDGNIYGKFTNARTGKEELLPPYEVSNKVLAFPGFQNAKTKYVTAIKNGKTTRALRKDVDYYLPNTARMFSQGVNLNPMPTSMQAGRQFYAAKFGTQFLPVADSEAPLVDTLTPDGKTTFRQYYGRKAATLSSGVDGTVTSVRGDKITITDDEGKKHTYDAVKNFPFNRLTGISYTPIVEKGTRVNKGDMIAKSNFTDDTGSLNLGRNLKVAVIPAKGESHDDAIVISESAAQKLATDRLYGFDLAAKHGIEFGKDKYMSLFTNNYTKEQYETLDDDGVVKPGTVLRKGDPMILGIGPKLLTAGDAALGKLHKTLRNAFTDRAVTWDHDYEGTVVDAVNVRGRHANVNVTSRVPVQVADKLCVDKETEVLTREGWKYFKDLTDDDKVCSLNPETKEFDYLEPVSRTSYRHKGLMYKIESQQIDQMVTPNHKLYGKLRSIKKDNDFGFHLPEDIYGKTFEYKKDGIWVGKDKSSVTIKGVDRGHRWGPIPQPDITISTESYMALLGMWLSEGCLHRAHYGIDILQTKPDNKAIMLEELDNVGIPYYSTPYGVRIHGKSWYYHFKPFGKSYEKYIPNWVFDLPPNYLEILFKWLMWGDGHAKNGVPKVYTTTSKRLADDVQRLCLHIGISSRIVSRVSTATHILGNKIKTRRPCYSVQIINKKLTPAVNHSHVNKQKAQLEGWVEYDDMVYCVTLPKWHVMYTRRNGKPVWTGNSNNFAVKGVVGSVWGDDEKEPSDLAIGEIRPDKLMPQDVATGEPYEMLINPMTVQSRVSPNVIMELALGKVAKKLGKPIHLPQDPPEEGWAQYAENLLKEHGVSDAADIFDPETGRVVKDVGDGYTYMNVFHHLAEKKLSARGGSGGYDIHEQPSKGGYTGAKRVSGLDLGALLAHGVPHVIKDSMAIRGTKNEEYWKTLRSGNPLPNPGVPFIYTKFLNTLKAGGINPIESGSKTQILPMTDKAVETMAKYEVQSGDLLDDNFRPRPGGLFDPGTTGGTEGLNWTYVKLDDPLPNPVMEEPIRRVLGLKVKELEDIIAGKQELNGKTGGEALYSALTNVDPEKVLEDMKKEISSKRGSARDNAVKVASYMDACINNDIHPKEWMVSKVPVMPPKFRPVARLGDMALSADMNELYRDLLEVRNNVRVLKEEVGEDIPEERTTLYNAVKAVYGLGKPITPEGQSKNLKGALHQITGDIPKCYDSETEVLIYNGWIPFTEVDETMEIGTVNLETGELEYQLPQEVIHQRYVGPMVRTKTHKVDLLVTPNHNHYIGYEGKLEPIRADKVKYVGDLLLPIWEGGTDEGDTGIELVGIGSGDTGTEDYDGQVHCVTVPNGTVIVRRNGFTAVSGNSGLFQRQVISKTVDGVGRAVLTPDPSFDMDTIGLPRDAAWDTYEDFVIRKLARRGYPLLKAKEMVKERDKVAEGLLIEAMQERPVLVDRAPTWHKFNLQAFNPTIVDDVTIRVSPLILKSMAGDCDGDECVNRVIIRFRENHVGIVIRSLGLTNQTPSDIVGGMINKTQIVTRDGVGFITSVDLADMPHGEMICRKEGKNGEIHFYEMEDGIEVAAYDETTGKMKWVQPTVWSYHPQREIEVVDYIDGSQTYTDDDPRAVYGIPIDSEDLVPQRFTPSDALEKVVAVPKADLAPVYDETGIDSITPEEFVGTDYATIPLTHEFGRFLGIMVGDGWWDKRGYGNLENRWSLYCADNEGYQADKIKKALLSVFKVPTEDLCLTTRKQTKENDPSRFGDTTKYTYSFKGADKLCNFLSDQLDGHRDHATSGCGNKKLPYFFLSGNPEFRKGLICGLMDTDGSISIAAPRNDDGRVYRSRLGASFCTTSFRLAIETRLLFMSLGVRASITGGKSTTSGNPCWYVNPSVMDLKRTDILRGMSNTRKLELFDSQDVEQLEYLTMADGIPMPKSLFHILGKLTPTVKHPKPGDIGTQNKHLLYAARDSNLITRKSARKVLEFTDNRIKEQNELVERARTMEYDKEGLEVISEALKVIVPPYVKDDEPELFVRRRSALQTINVTLRNGTELSEFYKESIQSLLKLPAYGYGPKSTLVDTWRKIIDSEHIGWITVTGVQKTGIKEDGYDLTVPGYETFASIEGIVLSNTLTWHVPVSDKAVQEAREKMMPSRNLIMTGDLRNPMHTPKQEMSMGLYALTRAPSKKAPVRFRTAQEAKDAYSKGLISANDPIDITG